MLDKLAELHLFWPPEYPLKCILCAKAQSSEQDGIYE